MNDQKKHLAQKYKGVIDLNDLSKINRSRPEEIPTPLVCHFDNRGVHEFSRKMVIYIFLQALVSFLTLMIFKSQSHNKTKSWAVVAHSKIMLGVFAFLQGLILLYVNKSKNL